MSWVKGYKIPFIENPVQYELPQNKSCSETDTKIIDDCVADLLKSQFISPCIPCQDQYISPIFTVPKPNVKHRFILNLKGLNKYIDVQHFKMEDYRTVLKLIEENDYMATIDIQDAYFLVNIDIEDRKKLRFQWRSNIFEFNVLPFGICTAPFVFTKLLKPILHKFNPL